MKTRSCGKYSGLLHHIQIELFYSRWRRIERGNKREEGKEACEGGEGGGRPERRRAGSSQDFTGTTSLNPAALQTVSAEIVDLPDEEDEQRSNTAALMRTWTRRPHTDGNSSSDLKVNNV